ncbi:MAG: glycosyltransferase family 4 protein [Candidatus Limnocylindria bacterium]
MTGFEPPPPRAASDRLRIALLAAPMESVPPVAYGGTERIVGTLAAELSRRGHAVTLFAAADSRAPCALEPIAPQALWAAGYRGDVSAFLLSAVAQAWEQADRFDIIHSHVEAFGFLMARHCPTPVLSTLHGRLDRDGMPELLDRFGDIPLVAISTSQRGWAPHANWVATIHHGLALEQMPFADDPGEYLLVVGRAAPEKGVAEAIELARRVGLPLKMVMKVHDPAEMELFERVLRPAVDEGVVDFLGELPPAERDPLYAAARATLMLGSWPEPFGLVAIESLATGTPVIARRGGALPEIVEHGGDGYLVDDLSEAELAVRLVSALDRAAIRRRALQRFSAARMAADYERIYLRLLQRSVEPSVHVPAAASRVPTLLPVGVRSPVAAISHGPHEEVVLR